jgi:hypothetical protein
MNLTMIHSNPATVAGGVFTVDRKFHVGMLKYAEQLPIPLTTIHPQRNPDQAFMDHVMVQSSELPYRVVTIQTDRAGQALRAE